MSQNKVVLLLGSNLGDRKKNIERAVQLIEEKVGHITTITDFFITEPVEFVSLNYFCNIALSVNTSLSPFTLLSTVKKIEVFLGRKKDSSALKGYYDRIIDIDIVRFSHLNYICKKLIIPHKKHIESREFSKILLNNLELSEKHKA